MSGRGPRGLSPAGRADLGLSLPRGGRGDCGRSPSGRGPDLRSSRSRSRAGGRYRPGLAAGRARSHRPPCPSLRAPPRLRDKFFRFASIVEIRPPLLGRFRSWRGLGPERPDGPEKPARGLLFRAARGRLSRARFSGAVHRCGHRGRRRGDELARFLRRSCAAACWD